jgi:bifunctional DNA-binding transcriptional regulator/antitoxin component of YhaV-PrlF toxin-antitoxin module
VKSVAKRIRLLDEENPAIRIVGFVGGSKSVTIPTEWCGDLGIAQGDYVVLQRGAYEGTKYGSVVVIQKLNAMAAHRDGGQEQTQTQAKAGTSG